MTQKEIEQFINFMELHGAWGLFTGYYQSYFRGGNPSSYLKYLEPVAPEAVFDLAFDENGIKARKKKEYGMVYWNDLKFLWLLYMKNNNILTVKEKEEQQKIDNRIMPKSLEEEEALDLQLVPLTYAVKMNWNQPFGQQIRVTSHSNNRVLFSQELSRFILERGVLSCSVSKDVNTGKMVFMLTENSGPFKIRPCNNFKLVIDSKPMIKHFENFFFKSSMKERCAYFFKVKKNVSKASKDVVLVIEPNYETQEPL